ncbi:lymphocyte antigen 6E-like [Bombina bombina]|uniref:lymphocyte antigen 6E-like n=1 Tax=Bombina bombina TaxID=8345 RepID=UPI00235A5823|nr:lymphocyte antigen 6E-like [Bombina bombina]
MALTAVRDAYSLSCYTCTGQSSNAQCMTAANCTASETSCETTVVAGGIGALSAAVITKQCVASCTASSFGVSAASTTVSCCNTDLCNISGAFSVKSSYTILALSMVLLLALLRNSSL